MENLNFDILIVGGGGAGLRAALEAKKNPDLNIGVISGAISSPVVANVFGNLSALSFFSHF